MKNKYLTSLTLIVLLVVSLPGWAQTLDSIAHHFPERLLGVDMRNMLALRDGTVVVNCQLFDSDEQFNYIGDYGNLLYKVDPIGPHIIDSVFIEDHDLNFYLIERNPFGNDNIYATAVRDTNNLRTDLRISFFDDNLNFKEDQEVCVPLLEGEVSRPLWDSYYLDPNGDILVHLYVSSTENMDHFFLVGLDGTMKAHSVTPHGEISVNYRNGLDNMTAFNREPIEHCYFGARKTNWSFHVVLLDSLLNPREDLLLDDAPSGYKYDYGYNDQMIVEDGGTVLVTTRFAEKQNSDKNGVRVSRYDKESLNSIKTVFFKTWPMVQVGPVTFGCAFPIGLVTSDDGSVYYAYSTQDPVAGHVGQIAVVRMDHDLNVIWERFCLEPEGYSREASNIVLTDDGIVAVCGYNHAIYNTTGTLVTPPNFFFLFLDNDGVGLFESDAKMRPFFCYPNPVDDRFHVSYSPDVKPERVELFDLQGRLLRSQGNPTADIDMGNLPAGTYTVRISLDNGKTYSEMVMKK